MNRSETQSKIAPALVAALGEIKNPAMGGVNPHFRNKYAKLHDILAITRPTLLSHGLCAMQDASGSVLILHTSGEWIEFPGMPLTPSKNDPQGHVAALTYARRAYLTAALGICGDEDDDGNSASSGGSQAATGQAPAQRSTGAPRAVSGGPTEKMVKYVNALWKDKCEDPAVYKQQLLDWAKVTSTKDLTYEVVKEEIEKFKDAPDWPRG